MKLLTIKQPWASLICLGIKDVENRTWRQNNISHLEIKKNVNAIREACDYAIIDSRIVEIIKNPENATIICKHICDYYNLTICKE